MRRSRSAAARADDRLRGGTERARLIASPEEPSPRLGRLEPFEFLARGQMRPKPHVEATVIVTTQMEKEIHMAIIYRNCACHTAPDGMGEHG
jgi:hypothetical protein